MEINSTDLEDDTDYRNMPMMKVNSSVKDELRTPQQIKKIVTEREKMKMKNMEKGKRKKVEAVMRKKKNFQKGNSSSSFGGGKGKGMKFKR
jgi:hypothetical protein